MKVVCERKDLREGLQGAARAVSGKSTIPILGHVLFRAKDGQLQLAGTDLEMSLEVAVGATVEREGAVTLPAALMNDILGLLPEAALSLDAGEDHVAGLRCAGSDYAIRGLPAEDFPVLPDAEWGCSVRVEEAVLSRLVRETEFAASTDQFRALLTGAMLELNALDGSSMKMVATDSHRLAVSTAPAPAGVHWRAEAAGVIIPTRALHEVARVLGDEDGATIDVRLSTNLACFEKPGFRLVTRLIDGQFPHFERVIPEKWERRLVAARQELLGAIRRACVIYTARETPKVVFRAGGGGPLDITTEARDVGRAHERVDASHEGEDVEVALNGRFVADMLAVTDAEDVAVEMTGPLNPVVIRPVVAAGDEPEGRSYLYVIMPMAVD